MDLPALATLDWALLAVLAASVLMGLWRGLMFEILSLLGWVAAWIVAQIWGGQLAAALPLGNPGTPGRLAAGLALAFVGTLIACSLLARLARWLISATPLSLVDRVLGAGFGLARGLLMLMVITTLLMLTPAVRSPMWQASRGVAWLDAALRQLRPWLPEGVVLPSTSAAGGA